MEITSTGIDLARVSDDFGGIIPRTVIECRTPVRQMALSHRLPQLAIAIRKDRMKRTLAEVVWIAVIAMLLATAGCSGGKVEGNTYEGNGGVIKIEFKSGGKAYVSTGPVTTPCTYAESGKTVTLTCEGDKTVFTVDDDGALNGPKGGFLARLTKKK